MIKDLHFISGLYPDLAKSSLGLSSLFLHLPIADTQFSDKQKFLKKTLMCRQGNVGTVSTGVATSGIGRIPEIDEESKWWGHLCQRGNC
jgi:hypothetical protein